MGCPLKVHSIFVYGIQLWRPIMTNKDIVFYSILFANLALIFIGVMNQIMQMLTLILPLCMLIVIRSINPKFNNWLERKRC